MVRDKQNDNQLCLSVVEQWYELQLTRTYSMYQIQSVKSYFDIYSSTIAFKTDDGNHRVAAGMSKNAKTCNIENRACLADYSCSPLAEERSAVEKLR